MILTPGAANRIRELAGSQLEIFVRVEAHPENAPGEKYSLEFVDRNGLQTSDVHSTSEGIVVVRSGRSDVLLRGTVVDYRREMWRSGFHFDNPNRGSMIAEQAIAAEVRHVLESVINPLLEKHHGRALLADVWSGVVYVEFGGGCLGCAMAPIAARNIVGREIVNRVNGVRSVVDITTHELTAETFEP